MRRFYAFLLCIVAGLIYIGQGDAAVNITATFASKYSIKPASKIPNNSQQQSGYTLAFLEEDNDENDSKSTAASKHTYPFSQGFDDRFIPINTTLVQYRVHGAKQSNFYPKNTTLSISLCVIKC